MGKTSRAHHSTFVSTACQPNNRIWKRTPPLPTNIDLKIVAVDQDGTPLKQGGDQFTSSVAINGQPQVGLVFLFFFPFLRVLLTLFVVFVCCWQAAPTITDQQNGTYTMSFTPTVSGKCVVSVKFEGKEIKGGPFTSDVLAADFFGAGKQYEVLYDAKVDGYSSATFHQKCDQVNATVSLVTLKNGAKFGGYNPDNWSGTGYRNVQNTFLFSLTDGKGSAPHKFSIKQGQEGSAIHCISERGPTFGGGLSLFTCVHFRLSSDTFLSNFIFFRSRSLCLFEQVVRQLLKHTPYLLYPRQHHPRWIGPKLGL